MVSRKKALIKDGVRFKVNLDAFVMALGISGISVASGMLDDTHGTGHSPVTENFRFSSDGFLINGHWTRGVLGQNPTN